MKKIYKVTLIILSIFLLNGCMEEARLEQFTDEALSSTINVRVSMPTGFSYPVAGLVVKLNDPTTGLSFQGTTNSQGEVAIHVAHGSYFATTETKFTEPGGIIYIFNATSSKIRVSPIDPKSVTTNLNLTVSKAGQIVIKEVYYGGCFDIPTNKSYSKDQYIILYNNSSETAYLDSLCIGVTWPYNAPSTPNTYWYKTGTTELRDSVPMTSHGWMFPGTGNSLPLQPAGQVVLALNAIDHSLTVTASVNLGVSGYWALYNATTTKGQSVPNVGVNLMENYWKVGTATSYVLSSLSPAVFIFNMGGKTSTQFITDTYTWNLQYPTNRNFDVLMVDKNLVLDGVDCFRNLTDYKRLRPEIDNGFAKTDGSGQGQSIHRKVDIAATAAANGRIVYQDTNNSSNDFEKRTTVSLKQ